MKGLRSRREIQQILDKSIEVQYANPAHKYKVVDKLGKGGQAEVYKVKRKEDDKFLAMKTMQVDTTYQKNELLNEFKLFATFKSDYILNCQEVFYWNQGIYAFLDLMTGGSIVTLINKNIKASGEFLGKVTYSE